MTIKALSNNENVQTFELLKLVSDSEKLTIEAVPGTEIIPMAEDLFGIGELDEIKWAFKNYEADDPGTATDKTIVEVYKMQKHLTFTKVFNCLNCEIESLCLTQHQILEFIRKYRCWVNKQGETTLFPFISKGKTFVAVVIAPKTDSTQILHVNLCHLRDEEHEWWVLSNVVVPILFRK